MALDWPGGRWIVGGVGLAILCAGAFNAYRALSGSFRDDLREEQMSGAEQPWYTAFGVIGHLARAVVFGLIGIFVLRAAYEYDPDEAIGLDGALQKLAGEAYGPVPARRGRARARGLRPLLPRRGEVPGRLS